MSERRKNLKLSSANDVRRSLSRIANMLMNGEINPQYANAITTLCNSILGSIRTDEQDRKIKELEEIIEEMKKK
jgi:hypothetical protein